MDDTPQFEYIPNIPHHIQDLVWVEHFKYHLPESQKISFQYLVDEVITGSLKKGWSGIKLEILEVDLRNNAKQTKDSQPIKYSKRLADHGEGRGSSDGD